MSEEFISKEALEAEFKEIMNPKLPSGRLIITGPDLNAGVAESNVYEVTDMASPTEEKTVILVSDCETGDQFKFTFEFLGEGKK